MNKYNELAKLKNISLRKALFYHIDNSEIYIKIINGNSSK